MQVKYQLDQRELLIRPVMREDLPLILHVYNHFVIHSNYTMDTDPKTRDDMLAWYDMHQGRFPAYVGFVSGELVGYSSLSQWAERKGYYQSCEAPLYLSPIELAQGCGDAFMNHLHQVARDNQFTTILSFMTATNKLAKNLVKRNGYIYIGVMCDVAKKFDRNIDVAMYQYFLDDARGLQDVNNR